MFWASRKTSCLHKATDFVTCTNNKETFAPLNKLHVLGLIYKPGIVLLIEEIGAESCLEACCVD